MPNRGLERQARGRFGEVLAAWFLRRRGYRIVERNLRLGRFEIDLVAERGAWLVLVEVKYRGSASWERAAGALSEAQRRRLAAAAEGYAARHATRGSLRFDVVVIEDTPERFAIEHHPDALGAGGELR
jgi:putative endonuclease